ncbi:MAG TPA: class I SAM-dependent methyltransferase [Steroidobacteraceae bacterium]|nr:class I SAM-dependent methyltransferase [Steroidobacteraceae bacterium]
MNTPIANRFPPSASDAWSRWLLHLRHGGDEEYRRKIQKQLNQYANRVLDGARLGPGMTLADVGCGEGLIGFGAIDRIGESLNVILTDISEPMIAHTQALAMQRGVLKQCRFVQCTADDLAAIPSSSVDVVATRAVLAYVTDKNKALREFFRILKPGGRISLAEPIFQDEAFAACALRAMVSGEMAAANDPFRALLHRWKAAQFPDTQEQVLANPLTGFSERTLFEMVRLTEFAPIHAELHMDFDRSDITSWEVFLGSCPHPWAPSLRDIFALQFSPQEQQYFEQIMRPLVESGQASSTSRTVYIAAEKPLP